MKGAGWIAFAFVGLPAILFGSAVLLYVLGDHFGATFWVVLGLGIASYVGYLYGKTEKRSGE
jgi:hypothetical protein